MSHQGSKSSLEATFYTSASLEWRERLHWTPGRAEKRTTWEDAGQTYRESTRGCDLMQQVLWQRGHLLPSLNSGLICVYVSGSYIREEALLETELVLFPFLQHNRYGPRPGVMNAGNGLRGITVSSRKGIRGPRQVMAHGLV